MKNLLNEQLRQFNYMIGEIDRLYCDAALKMGLTDSALSVLCTLSAEGAPCRISDICRLTGVSKQTINSALRRLEGDGVILLRAVNGKQKAVELTEKGERLAKETAERLIEAENRLFEAWTDEERAEYLRLTSVYRDGLKKAIDEL